MLHRNIIDPGLATGVAVAYWDGTAWRHPAAYTCDARSAAALVDWLAGVNAAGFRVLAAVEEFRTGTGAGSRGQQAVITRALVEDITKVLAGRQARVRVRPAATVKPWATDTRLSRAGLWDPCARLPHARDAMKQILFRACHDERVPDPLSRGYAYYHTDRAGGTDAA